jgi:hypothetical protein
MVADVAGRSRVVSFFVVRVPPGMTPRAWGKKHWNTYGFEYDNARPRVPTELLLWPSEISAATLRHRLQAGGLTFRTFRADPERMLHVTG